MFNQLNITLQDIPCTFGDLAGDSNNNKTSLQHKIAEPARGNAGGLCHRILKQCRGS